MSATTHSSTRTQRPRHAISPTKLLFLKPFFRYSTTRDAWVLRGIGNTHGPVLVERR